MLDIGWFIEDAWSPVAMIMMVMGVVGCVALVTGGVLADVYSWWWSILALAGVGLIILAFYTGTEAQEEIFDKLNSEIGEVLVEEGGVDTPPVFDFGESVVDLTGGKPYFTQEVEVQIGGEAYLTTLMFKLNGDDLSIGVVDGSTSSIVPLSPEAVLGAQKVDILGS